MLFSKIYKKSQEKKNTLNFHMIKMKYQKIQQDTIQFYEDQIQLLNNDIEDLQEYIDCRNVSRMEELEEDNDKLRYLIRQYEPMLGSAVYQYQE